MSNIILIGFMASGKSKIGRMLAEKLGFSMLDLDEQIEKKCGRSIGDIFAHEGEEYFRKLEKEELQSLKDAKNTVIISGGGTPMSFACSKLLQSLGTIFFLDAPWTLIEKRLLTQRHRPLAKYHSLDYLHELYEFRHPIYEKLGVAIDVAHEDKQRIVDDILNRIKAIDNVAHLKQLEVFGCKSTIFIGDNSVDNLSAIITLNNLNDHKMVVITNETIHRVQREKIEGLSRIIGQPVVTILVPDGEQYKNLATIQSIIKNLFAHRCTRKTAILSIGGGVVGDMAGFAASIFMRGIPIIQIPTTLLAMVDSSVGGKTGVDLPEGKNLVGTFHQPAAVLIDTSFLSTLPKDEYSAGMAEVIKHGIIGDKDLFNQLLLHDDLKSSELIYRAVKVKRDIVAVDPFEHGVRAHLNLGHTFGHAIEKVSNYEIKHGFAVAMGLVLATQYAKFDGSLEVDFLKELIALLEKYDLPTMMPAAFKDEIVDAMLHDKKRDNQGLRLILPRRLGEVGIKHCDEKSIRYVLSDLNA